MGRRLAALFVALCGAWPLAAGCTASGSTSQVNGPSYDLEAGGDDAGDTSARGDAAGSVDTGARADAPIDGDGATSDGTILGDVVDAPNESASSNDAAGEDAGCTATTVILEGNDLSLFGATEIGQGAFAIDPLSGSLGTAPALVSFGGGFQGLIAEATEAGGGSPLFGLGFADGGWSVPSALGGSAATIDAPAVAVVGSTLQGVYLNPSHFLFQASYTVGWDMGEDPVRPPDDAGGTAFGPVRAAAAGTASDFVIAYEGSNSLPYAQTWTSGVGWDDGVALGTAPLLANTAMAIAGIDGETGASTSDLVAVYVDGEGSGSTNTLHLFFVVRSAATKAWSSPAMVDANAFTAEPPVLTAMTGGGVLLAWQGQSGGVYGSVLTAEGAFAWSSPAQISAATASSAPSVAAGVCGDDAVAAYVSLGSVYTAHFAGGAWTAPAPLAGEAGMTYAAIATSP